MKEVAGAGVAVGNYLEAYGRELVSLNLTFFIFGGTSLSEEYIHWLYISHYLAFM